MTFYIIDIIGEGVRDGGETEGLEVEADDGDDGDDDGAVLTVSRSTFRLLYPFSSSFPTKPEHSQPPMPSHIFETRKHLQSQRVSGGHQRQLRLRNCVSHPSNAKGRCQGYLKETLGRKCYRTIEDRR